MTGQQRQANADRESSGYRTGINPGTLPDDCPLCEGAGECDEGGFSWRPCELCGSQLGGDRYAAHGYSDRHGIVHYDVCVDCVMYLANGEEYPESE